MALKDIMSGQGVLKCFHLLHMDLDKDSLHDKHLPYPSEPLSKVVPSSAITSCNGEVRRNETAHHKTSYMKLTPAQRYEIGKKGPEMGVSSAIWYYKNRYPDLSLTKPTIRWLKNLYKEELAKKPLVDADSSDFSELQYKKIGRPLNVGKEVDRQVQAYVKKFRKASAPVNTQ